MKKYHLIVMYPGMSSLQPTIIANEFEAKDGGYYFYGIEKNHLEGDRRILKRVYPICSTIINLIEIV
jgi:hypothetical protein